MSRIGRRTRAGLLAAVALTGAGAMTACAAQQAFMRADTLRGSVTPERAWWDLTYYDLHLRVDPDARTVSGHNVMHYVGTARPPPRCRSTSRRPWRSTAWGRTGRVSRCGAKGMRTSFAWRARHPPESGVR